MEWYASSIADKMQIRVCTGCKHDRKESIAINAYYLIGSFEERRVSACNVNENRIQGQPSFMKRSISRLNYFSLSSIDQNPSRQFVLKIATPLNSSIDLTFSLNS